MYTQRYCVRNANLYLEVTEKKQNWLFSIFSNKLGEHEDEDENKVPDLSRTKLVLVFVIILGLKSKALYYLAT